MLLRLIVSTLVTDERKKKNISLASCSEELGRLRRQSRSYLQEGELVSGSGWKKRLQKESVYDKQASLLNVNHAKQH